MKLGKVGALLGVLLLAGSAAIAKSKPKKPTLRASKASKNEEPKAPKTFDEIVKSYVFVGDFEQKDSEREVSDEVFWRYPLSIPKIEFPFETELKDPVLEMPATKGEGRAVDHLNRGRILFLDKQLEEAKNTWLSARARYGKKYPFHRRNDYFIGMAFLNLALADKEARHVEFTDQVVKGNMANAGTFLSWALIVKTDHPDPLVEKITPKGLYNLAAIYWRYDRFEGAFGAAETGLNYLRKTGRKEYRPVFNRFTAEAHIKNRSYLEAVRQLDTAIRQDIDPENAAAAFARAGDIYFDLNNYVLAEDAYSYGAQIDEELRQINPAQLVLRGESLFWLGKFSESQKMLHMALEGTSFRRANATLPEGYAGWAALRIADGYLARHEFEKAKLEYYKVRHAYGKSLPARLAKIREACLELPDYRGNNVKHARDLLEEAKSEGEIPEIAREIGWACQVGSYTDRERTEDMLGRVRAFATSHPESRFLKSFATPVREYQASKIDEHFKAKDPYSAVSFFEKTRKVLFPRISEELAAKLFAAYADVGRPAQAAEFWGAYAKTPDTDERVLRQTVVAVELSVRGKKEWVSRQRALAKELAKRNWRLEPSPAATQYVSRVFSSPLSEQHAGWIANLSRSWSAKDHQYLCDLEYPALSVVFDANAEARAGVLKRVSDIIATELPELFKNDESCALSLLELEVKGLRPDTKALGEAYIKRSKWPLVGGYLHLYWTVSEHLYDDGDRDAAVRMWTVIRDGGPKDAPEVQFARARLDPTRTEYEKLWD